MAIRAHARFDGRALVLDEPVDLPINARVTAEVELETPSEPEGVREAAQGAWEEFKRNPIAGLSISDESLRRENLYDERW